MNSLINQLFANLDMWRHFPAYQLERRADVFFSVYLPDYLRSERGYDVQAIIPEFPIRVGTIHSSIDNINKSYKVDYLIKLRNPSQVVFVELKTDPESRRIEQDDYLKAAKESGMRLLLGGLKKIYNATSSQKKYRHLLRELEAANLIRILVEDDFDIVDAEIAISILYLRPKGEREDIITFDQFAKFVDKKQDELSQRFAKSLTEWARVAAGASGT